MMSHQQQMGTSRASVNGFPHRKLDREGSGKNESKMHLVKSSSGGFSSAENGGKLGQASPSKDRLIYVLTQLIGHHVDVHVKNGSVFSGIFHATNSDKDFGVVLKMAQMVKDGSVKGQKYAVDIVKKPETMIIPARELVQILAKDVALGGDELPKGPSHDKRKDLLIDSAISRTHYLEERELERWAPDEGDSECLELDKYDRKGNRSWDQFETNATLFGVKSTFNEEIYTTKLERGPHMRELEKHASRLAKEIEGEDTKDIHLAEVSIYYCLDLGKRLIYLDDDLDHDEEDKYYSADEESSFVFVDADPSSNTQTNNFGHLTSDHQTNKPLSADENRLDKKLGKDSNADKDNRNSQSEGVRPLISEEWFDSRIYDAVLIFTDLDGLPSSSQPYESSSSRQGFKSSDGLKPDLSVSGKHSSAVEPANSLRPSSSTSSTSERVAANSVASAPGLSPSSSMGSLTSEKSTLNPNAKEFKLNPNAKSFTPSVSMRPPHPPASDGSYYYPNNMPTSPLGPGLPVGMGFPPTYGGQPMVYNAQPGTSPQGYMHPAGPQYGQQMMMGQTRPVYYYAPDMQQYRGRNF
ncbi:hypothetical protein PR202_gb08521 [Eleusine coracana subsp. coracana]|uniref:Sm domain-containing protein n=1 Tax=Eleusine coracana subsp. coracana TaxID=191504 RepID=A0AAV5ECC5_ELECO|nr:hypothetical protein PR202_gb08521 [Eleusine coracana subsp. coracana]